MKKSLLSSCSQHFYGAQQLGGISNDVYIFHCQATFQVPPVKFASPGRSGAKFYLSQNKEYYVKTLESEEVERMHNILPQYHHVSLKAFDL